MNIYDFDGTIYDGDSTIDFWLFILRRHPWVIFTLPSQIKAAILHKTGKYTTSEMKEQFFSFVRKIPDIHAEAELFREKKQHKIKSWYLDQKRSDDLIISASPEFLLAPFCRSLGNISLIATMIDPVSGRMSGENCKGIEKVKRFQSMYGDAVIDEFYSDSLSDLPMAKEAGKAFLVNKNDIKRWEI